MEIDPLILSFEVATIAMVIAGVIGIAVAALIANYRFPGRSLVDVFFTAPMVMPPTVLGYYVLVALGNHSVIGKAYEAVTGSQIVFTKAGAVVAASIGSMPLVVKTMRTAVEEIDPTLVIAARTLGATPMRAFLTIQLPLAYRGVVASMMLAFARSLGEFGITLMVAGDIPKVTKTASLAVYDAIISHREDDALAMIVVLTVTVSIILYAVNKLTEKK